MPNVFSLDNAYPNPFNPSTTINYTVGENSYVDIAIYDITGRVVDRLVSEYQETGRHGIVWNAEGLPSGLYFVRFDASDYSQTQKLMLIK